MGKIIGIYGGSFNPIHFGHKGIAKWVVENTFVDEVWLMVSPNNPLKDSKILAPEQERLEQAKEYVKDLDNVIVSDFEFNLPRPSYMAKTLKELKKTYPEYQFVLIIGEDNVSIFNQWKNYEYILKNHRVLIYPRNFDKDKSRNILVLPENDNQIVWKNLCGYDEIYLWNAPLFDISSTEIRNNKIKK